MPQRTSNHSPYLPLCLGLWLRWRACCGGCGSGASGRRIGHRSTVKYVSNPKPVPVSPLDDRHHRAQSGPHHLAAGAPRAGQPQQQLHWRRRFLKRSEEKSQPPQVPEQMLISRGPGVHGGKVVGDDLFILFPTADLAAVRAPPHIHRRQARPVQPGGGAQAEAHGRRRRGGRHKEILLILPRANI